MIDYLQVQRLSIKNNVSLEIIEKDYFITRKKKAFVFISGIRK